MHICHDYVDKAVNIIQQHAIGIWEKITALYTVSKLRFPKGLFMV